MFSKLLKKRAQIRAPESPAVPDGIVVWAVGDIHGRLDLLAPLVSAIRADAEAAARTGARTTVIFLGDYIDRGPESRGVIRYLADLTSDHHIEWRFLKGNHEQAMLEFLGDPSGGAKWCDYGGGPTLNSFGLEVPSIKHRQEGWNRLSADLVHKLTPAERAFLGRLELQVTVGDYFFAHAGARPGQPLDEQTADDLMWIRRSFLDSDIEFDRVVVHGHTPTAEVHSDRRRIGIDTRAYESGVLTGLRLQARARSVVQAVSRRERALDLPLADQTGDETGVMIRAALLPSEADLLIVG